MIKCKIADCLTCPLVPQAILSCSSATLSLAKPSALDGWLGELAVAGGAS
ncbi:MAG: hypothetical protein KJ550_03265 [Proteobacteria bacterium]|nr:hypothetical protein [Pseudomonadota bacterium]MBU4066920.1 hypothetical protein [Pseudomonadota bacterium]MBU4101973.1 hypothetical protein [Pseudomonadota bacterium]MBU4125976.1 hypothetical protein [Pseudomonadota bacterium]MBU4208536.1 hypothetical protein [Pseudomonadota bacterium]